MTEILAEAQLYDVARLRAAAEAVFRAVGCPADEAAAVAEHLAEANLCGHDSHGVIRVLPYVKALRRGYFHAGRTPEVVREAPALAVLDGAMGLGQPLANAATDRACAMAAAAGSATVLLRRAGHVGRLGAYAERAAARGMATVIFCNAPRPGGGVIAPWGGIGRRLGASPIAMGMPRPPAPPVVLDFSTSYYAVGKLRVARNRGELLPDPAVIAADGTPTRDPNAYFGPPEGAMIPFGGHKGYALNVFTDLLAGMLSGGGADYPAGLGRAGRQQPDDRRRGGRAGGRAGLACARDRRLCRLGDLRPAGRSGPAGDAAGRAGGRDPPPPRRRGRAARPAHRGAGERGGGAGRAGSTPVAATGRPVATPGLRWRDRTPKLNRIVQRGRVGVIPARLS